MSENRVDLGNVKGDKGNTGVGIARVVEMPSDAANLRRIFRIYYDDSTNDNPHYFEYNLTDNEFITRLNELTTGNPASDRKNVPTIYLLKQELNKRPLNTDVYRKELVYTKTETDNAIASAISNIEIVEVVSTLPTTNIETNKLYLLLKNADATDSLNIDFDLYIYVNNDWKKLDNLSFNITNYYTKTETNNLLSNKQNTANLSQSISTDQSSTTKYPSTSAVATYVTDMMSSEDYDFYTKSEIDEMISTIQAYIHS